MNKPSELELGLIRRSITNLSNKLNTILEALPNDEGFRITGDEWVTIDQITTIMDEVHRESLLNICNAGFVRQEYRDGEMKINLLSLLEHMGAMYGDYVS